MIARAIAASVSFKWVAGDAVYDVWDIEQQLRRGGKALLWRRAHQAAPQSRKKETLMLVGVRQHRCALGDHNNQAVRADRSDRRNDWRSRDRSKSCKPGSSEAMDISIR
jgi:hypothetical protein